MGIIKKVTNVDYSANAVGKYDFKNHIFRRIIDNKLERNYSSLRGGRVEGFTPIDLSKNYCIVKSFFVYGNHTGANNVFSIADYSSQRAFNVSHSKSGNSLILQFWAINGTSSFSVNYAIETAPTVSTNYECEFSIDFTENRISYIKMNGLSLPVNYQSQSSNPNAWNNGQTRTVCFGNIANYANSGTTSRALPYFGQVVDSNNNILVHFDFLGDNELEILTDKARFIQLSKTSEVTIESSPINIV